MQAKNLVQSSLKTGAKLAQNSVKYAMFAQSIAQHAASSVNLTSNISRSFSDQQQVQFEKVTSYESLISRISNASNINDLLNIMNQNVSLYKNEHVVLTLRVLARLIKLSSPSQIESLGKDERYQTLVAKAQENLEEFNEYEILDFLFWLRRFKVGKLPTHISEENLTKLYGKVRDFVKSKSFNFRNLVNLFYDLSCLNRNTDDIAIEILSELKGDSKLLTPFTVVQILQACSYKRGNTSPKESAVADYVQRNLNQLLPELDSDQKCVVFMYVAAMELHLNAPSYKIPYILFTLKNQLKDILDQLSEIGVNNILEAYAQLPREFPSDLLDEIKEMVIVTIQHNSENIKSFFLIDFLDKILNLSRGRKVQDDKILILYEEIAKRILDDDYVGRFKTIERLLNIYQRAGVKYEPLLDKIIQKINEIQGTFFSGSILQALSQHGKDITPILDRFIENGGLTKMGTYQRLQLYLVLSNLETDKYNDLKAELKGEILANPEGTYKLIQSISESSVRNPDVYDLIDAATESLKTKRGELNSTYFYKNMFFTVVNKKTRLTWAAWGKENLSSISRQELSRLIDIFFSLKEHNIDQILLFAYIIENASIENIPFRKLLSGLKDNKNFPVEFNRFEAKFNKFLLRLLPIMEQSKTEIRLQSVYSFVKRFDALGIRSQVAPLIAKKAYEIYKSSNVNVSPYLELMYALYLIDNGLLRAEDARQVYEKSKSSNEGIHNSSKIFAYVLQRSPATILENEEVVREVNEKLESLQKNLSETGAKTVLTSLASALAFPTQFLEPSRDLYVKSIKSFLNFGNQQLYSNILQSIPPQYVRKNYEFYIPIIRELITNYNNFNKRMNPSEIVKTLKRFADFNTRNPTIYNYILADIGRVFTFLRTDELVEVVNSFAKINIKQTDLFDKIIGKIGAFPGNYNSQMKPLLLALFKVGFNSPQAKTTFPEIFTKLNTKNSGNLLAFLTYLPILNLENEAQFLDICISNLKPEHVGQFPKKSVILVSEYLRLAYKDKPEYHETIKKLFEKYEEFAKVALIEPRGRVRARKIITDYLKVMKVDYQEDFSVDGFTIDLYIPEKKNLVKIFLPNDVNFDKFSLTGKALLTKKIYQSFEGYKTTFINMAEFNSIPENMNKINYLTATGIDNQNTEGTYDFSGVQQDNAKAIEEEVAAEENEEIESTEATAVIEEESSSDDEKPRK